MSRKKFKTLGIVSVLFLSFLSCDVSLLGGPFTEANPENEDDENNEFEERGFRVWVDGPSLYERGLMRVIAEDFGDGSMPGKGDEELKTRTKGYLTSKSGGDRSDYPVVWDFDWYGKPLRKGRLVFEVGIPNAHYEHSSLITGGYNSTISLRLMIPLADDVSEYSALDVYTSATNSPVDNPLQQLRIERGDFQTDVEPLLDSANYYRLDTVGGQKRADMLFLPGIFPDTHVFANILILPASLRPRLTVFSGTTAVAQLNDYLIAQNAFGLPWGASTPLRPAGSLEFRILGTGGTELSSYLLTADQVTFLRDSLLGKTLVQSPLASIYHGHQTYQTGSQTMGGVTYKTATVTRRSGSGSFCRYTIKVAGLSSPEETDDEFVVEVDRCLLATSGHSNSWDTAMDNFFTVMMTGRASNTNTLYHMTSAMVKPENQAQAFMVSPTKYTAHLKHSWLVGTAGYVVLRSWMQLVKPGNLMRLQGNATDITGAYPDTSYPEPSTLSITLLPPRRTMLESQTRVAPIYLWWPKEEALKIREAFSSAQ